MILKTFVGTWVILFSIFTYLAFSTKNIKIYLTGAITALAYFLAASEGIVYAFHRKIPIIGFLVNPFPGNYKLFILNWHYNWLYFTIALGCTVIVFLIFVNATRKKVYEPGQSINSNYIRGQKSNNSAQPLN